MPSKDYLNMLKSEIPESKPLPEQTKKDKAKNFWFYHRIHFMVGIIAIGLVGFFVYDMLSKVEPDVQFSLITDSMTIPTEVSEALERDLAAFVGDVNGDGEAIAFLNVYNIGDSSSVDPYMQMASVTRLAADMSGMTSLIYLVDDFDTTQEAYGVMSDKEDHTVLATTPEQAGYYLSETNLTPLTTEFSEPYLEEMYLNMYDEFLITKRLFTHGTDNEEMVAVFETGSDVFDLITQ